MTKGLTHVSIKIELFQLPLRGRYEMAIVGLIHSFNEKGLMMSNSKLATALNTNKRTIERSIARLKKIGIIRDIGTGKNDRCLVLTPDIMSVLGADMTADHKERSKEEVNTAGVDFFQCWGQQPTLPPIHRVTGARRRALEARMSEPDFRDNWKTIIDKLAASPFHTGQIPGKTWRATVDWILKPDKYLTILELPDSEAQGDEPDFSKIQAETHDATTEELIAKGIV